MKNITMPKLSDTMTEGVLGNWLKNVGDSISKGEIIAEIETDKATMGLESFEDGILLEKKVEEGSTVPVGTVLGIIGDSDEKLPVPDLVSQSVATLPNVPPTTTSVITERMPDSFLRKEKASPVVRRRAAELGIDLEAVAGSGPEGRILLQDIDTLAGAKETISKGNHNLIHQKSSERGKTEKNLPGMRAAIAATVSKSWRDIPHFYVTMEISMDNAEEFRRELQMTGSPVSVNDMILKGVAVSLLKFPLLNSKFTEEGLVEQEYINLGIVVNVSDGLLVPVVKSADSLTLIELADRCRLLVESARSGKLTSSDMGEGSFSVSNLGPQGVSQFSAIILPPQVGILAVGSIVEAVVVRSGEIVPAKSLKVTLSADHRAIDGAYAAGFLQELKSVLENPVRLLI